MFLRALNTYGICPVADPNVPSHVHRIMKAMALKQLQGANPDLYDARAVDAQILKVVGWDNPESLFAPPQPPAAPPEDPTMVAIRVQAETKMEELNTRTKLKIADLQDKDKERSLERELAMVDLAKTLATKPEQAPVLNKAMNVVNPQRNI